jgi:hypothetical protein
MTKAKKRQIMARYNELPENIQQHRALTYVFNSIVSFEISYTLVEKSAKKTLTMVIEYKYNELKQLLDLIQMLHE